MIMADYDHMLVSALETECKVRGVKHQGTREELIERLKQADYEDARKDNSTGGVIEQTITVLENNVVDNNVASEISTDRIEMMKEMEFLQRENELLKRENILLERERQFVERCSQSSVSDKPTLAAPVVGYEDLITEFEGEINTFSLFKKQIEIVSGSFAVDEKRMRLIVIRKLKGKVLKWFQSNPEHVKLNLAEMLDKIESLFSAKPDLAMARRIFDSRLWGAQEFFVDYFHDKITLAGELNINEDELVLSIIHGMNDVNLENNALILGPKDTGELFQAFKSCRKNKFENMY